MAGANSAVEASADAVVAKEPAPAGGCGTTAVELSGYLLFEALPGDPVRTMTRGRQVTSEQLAELRHRLRLDQPLPTRVTGHLSDLMHGDLGVSFC